MKNLILFLTITSLLFGFSSCKDDDDPTPEKLYSIQIMSPQADASFDSGADIHMHIVFNAVNTDIIHNIGYRILDADTGEEVEGSVYSEHIHADGTHELHGDLTLTVSQHSDFTLEVSAWDHDHGGPTVDVDSRDTDPNITTETVNFHVHP